MVAAGASQIPEACKHVSSSHAGDGLTAGERVLHGQRINGVVRVTDNPAGGGGRAYLVERELEQDGNAALQALVADYVEQAERHGVIPMHVPLGRYLAHIED